jgi:hypothetical protein
MPRVSPAWLRLREAADAAARASEFAGLVARRLAGQPGRETPSGGPLVVHDLGSGTGAMARWLAPRLPGPQHWILHDRDADLLALAAAGMVRSAADGAPVTVETRVGDISRLTAVDLRGAALVTASALLDLLTAEEVGRIAAACVGAGCPVLLTLSVDGRVELTPGDPLDARVAEAFNAHQRRTVGRRRLLGPDAIDATVAAFGRLGAEVLVRSSPWRLGRAAPAALTGDSGLAGGDVGPAGGAAEGRAAGDDAAEDRAAKEHAAEGRAAKDDAAEGRAAGDDAAEDQIELILEWFTGWVDAACEQRPALSAAAADYAVRRKEEAATGRLGVLVGHVDLFVA